MLIYTFIYSFTLLTSYYSMYIYIIFKIKVMILTIKTFSSLLITITIIKIT